MEIPKEVNPKTNRMRQDISRFIKSTHPILLAVVACALVALVGCNSKTATQSANKPTVKGETDGPSPVSLTAIEFDQKMIAEGLNTPAGLAVQPESGHVFVSTIDGVLRLDAENDFTANLEVIGFDTDSYGKGPSYSFGPLGLGFLDSQTLVVGGGGKKDGEDLVWLVDVPSKPSTPSLNIDQAKKTFGPITAGDDSFRGEGNFFGLCINDQKIYTASHGDDSKAWISAIDLSDAANQLKPMIAAKTSTFVDGPSGLAMLPDGKLLLAQTGELHESPDSILAVFDLESGELEKTIKTGLYDITSILVDPSGEIFVADFSWADPAKGGLYLVDLQGEGAVVKCASLVHPTALSLSSSGDIYVACAAKSENGDDIPAHQGKVFLLSRK